MSGSDHGSATRTQDEHEIRALVERQFESWGRGDAAEYVADFTDDIDYISYDGSRRGKEKSEELHRDLFQTVLYGSRLTGKVESIRFLTPDVAIVHLLGSIIEGWRETPLKRRLSRQTMVVVRRNGRWMITAFHNTRVRPVPTSGPMVELAGRIRPLGAPTGPAADWRRSPLLEHSAPRGERRAARRHDGDHGPGSPGRPSQPAAPRVRYTSAQTGRIEHSKVAWFSPPQDPLRPAVEPCTTGSSVVLHPALGQSESPHFDAERAQYGRQQRQTDRVHRPAGGLGHAAGVDAAGLGLPEGDGADRRRIRQEMDMRILNYRGGVTLTQMANELFADGAPDVLAFSVLGWNYRTFGCLAETFKQLNPDGWVIFGGTHVANQAERVVPHVP